MRNRISVIKLLPVFLLNAFTISCLRKTSSCITIELVTITFSFCRLTFPQCVIGEMPSPTTSLQISSISVAACGLPHPLLESKSATIFPIGTGPLFFIIYQAGDLSISSHRHNNVSIAVISGTNSCTFCIFNFQ